MTVSFPSGWKVHPCHPNSKKPIYDGWPVLATDDIAQIARWEVEHPGCNWGVAAGPSGLAIIDIDGTTGETSWFDVELEYGPFPETRVHSTPSGGRHLIFSGEIQNTVSRIAPKVDTRGQSGYIVIPPSQIDGVPYELTHERPIAELPDYLRDAAGRHREAVTAAEGVTLDTDSSILRARRALIGYAERGHIPGPDEDGDDYPVCCEILNLGLSVERAVSLALEVWAPKPHSVDVVTFLETTFANAASYSQNEPGAWAVSPTSERISSEALDQLIATSDSTSVPDVGERADRFAWMDEDEFKNMPPPEFIIPEMLIRRSLAVLFGKSGHFKSFIGLNLAAQIAQLGECAFYVAGEGINRMARNDYPAWKAAHGEEAKLPFYMMEDMPDATDGADYARFTKSMIKTAAGRPIGVVFLDTFNRAMSGLEENSARDIGLFIKLADEVRKRLNCTVVLVHHTGDGPQDKMRGSSAIFGGVDTVLRLQSDTKVKLAKLWVQKQKNAPERERPWCFEGRKFGAGLAFTLIDEKAAALMSADNDIYGPKHVSAVLDRMGARGAENGVTSHVLAQELQERPPGATVEEWNDTVTKIKKGLVAAAKGRAEAYAFGEGRALLWYIF